MSEQPDIDIKENYIQCLDDELLSILLKDRSSGKNIIWATDVYAEKGSSYDSQEPITVKLITGRFGKVIRPRTDKSKKEQQIRIKDKAEVFTPSWICNEMNNHINDEWFERKNIFNTSNEKQWTTNESKIKFSNEEGKTWKDYVQLKVLEISCGEAPFLVSRYDTTTGQWINVGERIGALDRKLRVVNENTNTEPEWYEWALNAIKSTFGYEWQGDSLLIARENILFTFIDYYMDRFKNFPIKEYLIEIAKILSWNIWQMDGLKYVVPNSCKPKQERQISLFQDEKCEPCVGCLKNDNGKHIGTYCKIMNWDTKRTIKFYKGEKRMKFDFVIGNPPYQENIKDRSEQPPVYHFFYDASFSIGKKVCLITPARFLFNAGKTPKNWNEKILSDTHFKVIKYEENSRLVFPSVEIKGGVAITYRDENKEFGAIGSFLKNDVMSYILNKVKIYSNSYLNSIIYSNTSYKYTKYLKEDYPEYFIKDKDGKSILSGGSARYLASSVFEKLPNLFCKSIPKGSNHYIKILGRKDNHRSEQYIKSKYINPPDNFTLYKVFISSSNGTGEFGEVLTTPFVVEPNVGATETFVSIGAFKYKFEADNLVKYLKTKFARALLGTLKVTQGNKNSDVWKNVPLQDFTDKSDIDWAKSIHEIDLQLYSKYGLDEKEISFIETHVKEMN